MNPSQASHSQAMRRRLHRWAACVLPLAGLLLGAWSAPVGAQQANLDSEATRLTQQWIDQELARSQSTQAMPLRMEVVVGSLDERLRLAPCAKVEPYLPAGQRLWGRTRLGLRCTDGAVRWNVFLPVQVKAFGPGWVLKGNVASGAVLNQGDAMEAEVDWAADNAAIVSDPAQWVGQVAARMLLPGQALRQSMVKPPQAFAAGTQVRVVAQGPGFQVTADGQALGAGVVGQLVRVRMENGRIMNGTVLDRNTVQVEI